MKKKPSAEEKAAERYPLKVENIGHDDYALMSRGHHDFRLFMEACREAHPTWSMGKPEHGWFRTVPCSGGHFNYLYVEATPGSRGAFPVTYTQEAYGEYQYQYEPKGRKP